MKWGRFSLSVICGVCLLGRFGGIARGQTLPGETTVTQARVAAHALYEEARRLMAVRDYTAACRLLERSQAIDAGIGTQLYLGECYRLDGRRASAWITFKEAAASAKKAGDNKRAAVAQSRAEELESFLSWLTLEASVQVKQLPGLAISVNGAGISPALLGAAFPVDPGAFLVVAGAPGYLDWGMQIDISEKSERQTLAIPMLQRKASPAPAVNTPKRNVLPTVPVAAAVSTESRASDSSLLGLSLAGAGVVATGLGVYLGARSGAHEDSAAQYCLPSGYCNKRGLDFMAQARTAAGWSNSLYAVGGGLILGAGWVLWAGSPRPTTSPRQARVILRTNVLLGRAELLGVF